MAKKQTFADKSKGKDGKGAEWVKHVKAVRMENGAWKFKTVMVQMTEENKKEIYG